MHAQRMADLRDTMVEVHRRNYRLNLGLWVSTRGRKKDLIDAVSESINRSVAEYLGQPCNMPTDLDLEAREGWCNTVACVAGWYTLLHRDCGLKAMSYNGHYCITRADLHAPSGSIIELLGEHFDLPVEICWGMFSGTSYDNSLSNLNAEAALFRIDYVRHEFPTFVYQQQVCGYTAEYFRSVDRQWRQQRGKVIQKHDVVVYRHPDLIDVEGQEQPLVTV